MTDHHSFDAAGYAKGPKFRRRMPDNFATVKREEFGHIVGPEDTDENTELWLVQVPQGFDVSLLDKALDKRLLDAPGMLQTVKMKTPQEKLYYNVGCYKGSSCSQKMSAVVSNKSGQVSVGPDLQNLMVVSQTCKMSSEKATSSLPAPKQPVPMPTDLKVRFKPFGSGTPCPSVSAHKKSKKKKKKSMSAEDTPCPSESMHKESKKRKKMSLSTDGDISPKKKCRTT